MKKIERLSICALLAASALGCTSRKTAAEAKAAASYEPASRAEPAPTATSGPAEPAALPSAAAAAAPAGDSAAEDDTWTDDTTAEPATATAAADQPETRTMEVIRKFVLDRREKVRPCYDKVQAGRPNFKGDVMMRFVLSPSGTVQQIYYAQAESSLYAPEVGECIAAEMKTWKFPASSRGMETKVGYPFNFNPRSK